jgi:hypothetical protein
VERKPPVRRSVRGSESFACVRQWATHAFRKQHQPGGPVANLLPAPLFGRGGKFFYRWARHTNLGRGCVVRDYSEPEDMRLPPPLRRFTTASTKSQPSLSLSLSRLSFTEVPFAREAVGGGGFESCRTTLPPPSGGYKSMRKCSRRAGLPQTLPTFNIKNRQMTPSSLLPMDSSCGLLSTDLMDGEGVSCWGFWHMRVRA